MSEYCELCGKPVVKSDAKYIYVDGAYLHVCINCYNKFKGKNVSEGVIEKHDSVKTRPIGLQKEIDLYRKNNRPVLGDEYEVVEDYANRIREARERIGWSQEALASKLKVSVSLIKRFESGRLKPGIELARRIERILGVKLLEPVVDEELEHRSSRGDDSLTIGDLIKLDKDKQKK
ncbi:MAG: multiprotein bridging factor aMBF1 [Desulfurococcaceae archaeon]